MKILYLVPHPGNTSPNKVLKNIILGALMRGSEVEVIYLKPSVENIFANICPTKKLSLNIFLSKKIRRFNIIHSQGFTADAFSLILKWKIGAKALSTVHSLLKQDLVDSKGALRGSSFAFIWYKLLGSFDAVVCLNSHSQYDLKHHSNILARIIPNGIELNQTSSHLKDIVTDTIFKLKSNGKKVLIASAVVRKLKGFDFVLNSIVNRNDWAFVLLGDGPHLNELKKCFKHLIETNRFLPLGYVDCPYSYYKYADVFVMSSYFEGFPMSLLEAVREEIPVACAKEPCFEGFFGCREIASFIREESSFISAIDSAYQNTDKPYKAKLVMEDKYSIESQQQAYNVLYESLQASMYK